MCGEPQGIRRKRFFASLVKARNWLNDHCTPRSAHIARSGEFWRKWGCRWRPDCGPPSWTSSGLATLLNHWLLSEPSVLCSWSIPSVLVFSISRLVAAGSWRCSWSWSHWRNSSIEGEDRWGCSCVPLRHVFLCLFLSLFRSYYVLFFYSPLVLGGDVEFYVLILCLQRV